MWNRAVAACSLAALAFIGTVVVVAADPAGAITNPYRRWSGSKTYTCGQDATGPYVGLSNQNVEFFGLAAGDRYVNNYITDGNVAPSGPFAVEQYSGSKAYGAFSSRADAFPFTFQFRIDTVVNGSVVYTSELKVTCTGLSSGSVTPVNTVVAADAYRRWSGPKAYSCSHSASEAAVGLGEQNVEFNGLPADAKFKIHYIDNGVDTVSGPYTVEKQNGTQAYGAFTEVFPSYPFTFEFRLDTIIAGNVVYTSKIVVTCTADGSGTVAPIHAAVTPLPFASWADLVTRQYVDLTGQPPSSSSLSTWVTRLSTGAKTKGELIEALRRGTDNTAHVDPVVRLYRAFLQRTPDSSGLRFWIARHRTGAWTLNRISQQFANSSEFKNKYGTLTNRQFVTRIYTDVLGRTPDAGGVDFWTGQLDSGRRNRGTVMVGFSESTEYKRKQFENTDAAVAHIFLLGRTPTLLEFNGWVSRQQAGTSQAELAKELLTSQAYADHVV